MSHMSGCDVLYVIICSYIWWLGPCSVDFGWALWAFCCLFLSFKQKRNNLQSNATFRRHTWWRCKYTTKHCLLGYCNPNRLLKFLIFLSLFILQSIPLSTTTSTTTTSPWKGEVPRVYDLSCDDTVCPPDSFCLTDYESGGSRCHCNLGRRGDTCSEGKKDFWISFFKNILCQLCSDSVVAILSRLQEVAFSSSNPWVLLLLICHDFSFHLSSFSVISEVSQIPWPLSHDLWTLKKLLSNLSDYFGV